MVFFVFFLFSNPAVAGDDVAPPTSLFTNRLGCFLAVFQQQ